jgi:hypothetical protein
VIQIQSGAIDVSRRIAENVSFCSISSITMEESKGRDAAEVFLDEHGNLRRSGPSAAAPSSWIEHVLCFLLGPGAVQAWKGITPTWNEITYAEHKHNDV